MSTDTWYLILFFLCIVFSAFFASSETAFISIQRFRLQNMVQSKVKGADKVSQLMERPEKFLSTVLLGNNFVNTAASALGTVLAVSIWGNERGVLIATAGVTIILLVFGETTPKTLATQHSEKIAFAVAPAVEVISKIFAPIVALLGWISSGFTKLFGGPALKSSLVAEDDIRAMITVGHKEGTVEEDKAELLHKVFEFSDRPVREVIVPRPEVESVEKGSTLKDFLDLYAESPMSRFPVYEDNMDNVLGILSIKDVLMALAKGTHNQQDLVDDLMRPAYFAPETKPIGKLFNEMREKNFRMCVVVDEYGGTAGIVSLSRLMEEIVGPVGDELAEAEKDYESINEYTFQVDGSMRIEEANAEMELDLPEGDYETIAGLILDRLGYIPKQGQQIKLQNLKVVITRMKGMKIDEVLITKEKRAASKS
ncbi:MAG: hemolysin family protein [Dehalococcoides mccartyi]|jgi:Hemolysins and related proteins containing CBS domains|uniref:Hemolysin n=3 Tax=root TaxID=1 RepID=A0A0V8M2E8_9CHLR|nr:MULTISPECIES: hemolysin family protein [Dehalococcoides]AAW39296.1 conserved hypothetical protein [Dehalococcoides mccartyi 195]AII59965.1 hemolysin [Dehalococcoides mccartyi CG4]AQU03634.1 hemolysin [Dehalococcoides mccartyi]AQU04934.1 hemolysin [Dehalococcoides mccartyi]KSV17934.1 hemolysin [Dehalococcoides mccartyi]